ncbi:MAG: glycine oxidase maturase GoxB [Thalassobaculum sp.]|uniref:glycine oxidase maturase GoxB n=1 Tax=Thalassobaculum sp. TaxID=2022740 RepID=UPI0032EB47ED
MTVPATADVAVVGGGIAGAAACIALHGRGQRVLWIAPDRAAETPVGESLAPAAGTVLAQLGVAHLLDGDGHRPANATFSAWGTDALVERNAAVHLAGPGRVLDRARFEAGLRELALAHAEHRSSALADARTVSGIWRLALADGSQAAARFLVDASGRAATLGRRVAGHRRDDRLVAACAFLPHRDPGVQPTPATLIEAVGDGWWYAALLPDGRLSLACFSDPDLLPRGLSRDPGAWQTLIGGTAYIARWIGDAGFGVEAPPRLYSAGTTWLDPVAGSVDGAGWAAIGDAAAAFDPLSSHGMTTALWTAERIGEAVPAWLAGDRQPLDGYTRAVADGVTAFRTQRAALYAGERRFAGRPFWRRRAAAAS